LILQFDEREILNGYVYRRRTSRDELGRNGIAKGSAVVEHDIFQFDAGAYARLISKNGVPIPEQGLDKEDSWLPFVPNSRSEQEAVIEDMFRVWKFQLVRRDSIAGRPALVVAFEPIANSKAETRTGNWMFKSAKGVAWIDAADHRIVRLRAVLINDISLGWGVVAKIHKGTEITREWRKVDNQDWLPSWSQKRLSGRAFMLGFSFLEIEEYSDYRKFALETNLRLGSPN
jgi:hypothetical protein